jgi:class 3 adenylate cyclase
VPGWRIALAYLYAECGRDDDARREIAIALDGLATHPEDAVWMPSMAMLANACALEDDAAGCARVYELLLPYAGRAVIVGAGVVCAGPVAFYLGLLAMTMRRSVEAALHFETAVAMCERLEARPWLARVQFNYARMLFARGEGDDRAKATTLLARALETGQALGMKRLLERALALKLEMEGVDASIDVKTSIGEVASTVRRERPDLRRHAAPDGTVTVLFTDIEGFAAMTARLGEAGAQELLRAHGAIVREQVAAHDGSEVRSRGDGFMVVFSSARRAVLCAIAIQRALVGYSARHPAEPIRGRIGLHTGEVLRDSAEFIDTNVTAAAHVASKAHGGEILVSAVLRGLTESTGDLRFGELRSIDVPRGSNVREVCEVLWAGGPGSDPARAPASGGAYVFRHEGEYWTLAHEGTICRLRDTKGLQHIAHLLRHPGQHFDARELAVESSAGLPSPRMGAAQLGADGLAVAGLGDAGAVLDATAKAAYKRRVEELREELEEAERFNDAGRAAAAREEIDFIAGQLSAAVGLGGRDREAASSAERARLTVTKRIKDAVARVRERHPGLGHYLAAHIKTGYLCAYLPEPERPISWSL